MIDFFVENRSLVYFVYGLSFLTLGLAVTIQTRAFSNLSNLKIANKLWLLAAFGLTHSFTEWGYVFIPIQEQYVSESTLHWLEATHFLITAISFWFLFQFGISLLNLQKTLYNYLPTAALLFWLSNFIYYRFFSEASFAWLNIATDTWLRYLLAFPGSYFSAYGLYKVWKAIKMEFNDRVAFNFLLASVVFYVYAIFAGLIVPYSDFFLARYINEDWFLNVTGIPVQLLRALCGFSMTYFIIKGLEIFRIEDFNYHEEAEHLKLIYEERNRIGRDLHDGTIQSIYSVGLNLENTLYLLNEDKNEASKQIRKCMDDLNKIVTQIRNYIIDIHPANFSEADLVVGLRQLIITFNLTFPQEVDLVVKGEPFNLNTDRRINFYYIIQEALNNIGKHSKATSIEIHLLFQDESLVLNIKDNGRGFDCDRIMTKEGAQGRGVGFMIERARTLCGTLKVKSVIGVGTELTLVLPRKDRENVKNNDSTS